MEESPDAAIGEDCPLKICRSHLLIEFVCRRITGFAIFIFDGFIEIIGPGSEFANTTGTVEESICTTATHMSEESICTIEERVLNADFFAKGFIVAMGVAKDMQRTVYKEKTNLSSRRIIIEMCMMAFKVLTNMLEFLCKFFTGKKVRCCKTLFGIRSSISEEKLPFSMETVIVTRLFTAFASGHSVWSFTVKLVSNPSVGIAPYIVFSYSLSISSRFAGSVSNSGRPS